MKDPFGIEIPLPQTKAPTGNTGLTINKANRPTIPENLLSGNLDAQITVVQGFLQSRGFISGSTNSVGWHFNSDGSVFLSGSHNAVSTHFTPILQIQNLVLFISDGTTPLGNLNSAKGSICLNGPAGLPYYNSIAGSSTWVAF